MHKDTYKLKGLRRRLSQEMALKGIKDEAVLHAIEKVPRHFFLETAFAEQAYEDKAFPIGDKQTISQPYTVAYQSQILEVKPGQKVLEIGTGSGYQACILAEMGAKVFSVERIPALLSRARSIMRHLNYEIKTQLGDGSLGWAEKAPFDKIIITAAAPHIPEVLLQQLAPRGFMVVPVGGQDRQVMKRVKKDEKGAAMVESLDYFKFVPLLGENGWMA